METTGDLKRRHRRQRVAAAGAVIMLAAAVALLYLYNRRTAVQLARGAYVPRPEKITREAILLRQYVRIDTSNPPGNETAGARWLVEQLEKEGIAAEVIEGAPGRANVYARIRGRRRGEGLLLLNHIDVVPADPKAWSHPPFSGTIQLNMLHGRGAIDMKGIAICQLAAFTALAKQRQPPEHDVVFLATADEETGGAVGVEWLLANRSDVFDGIRYVLTEGGTTEMQLEKIEYFAIETGSKQLTVVELEAASPHDLRRARLALEPHFFPRDPDRILPEVRRYLSAIAPKRVENRGLFIDVQQTVAGGKFWLLPLGYRELLQNNIWADGPREEKGRYRMTVRLINLPDQDPDARIEWLRGFVRPFGVTVHVTQKEEPVPISSEQTRLFDIIGREVRRAHPEASVGPQILSRATNDCRLLRRRGIVCYGVQPFQLDYFQTRSIHGVDERVRLDWFQQGVSLTTQIVAGYAGGE